MKAAAVTAPNRSSSFSMLKKITIRAFVDLYPWSNEENTAIMPATVSSKVIGGGKRYLLECELPVPTPPDTLKKVQMKVTEAPVDEQV